MIQFQGEIYVNCSAWHCQHQQKSLRDKTGKMSRIDRYDLENRILFEDPWILVLHKPGGIAVQSAALGEMDLESWLVNRQKGGFAGIVHRLDQPVEGVILMAKTPQAASILGKQVQEGSFGKKYLAVAAGNMPGPADGMTEITDYLLRDGRTNTSRVVPAGTAGAKKASLAYRILDRRETEEGSGTLLGIRLDTGRHHQIRVQLAHRGFPVLGDWKYSKESMGEEKTGKGNMGKEKDSLALCSAFLSFRHPKDKKMLRFVVTPEGKGFAPFAQVLCGEQQIENFLKAMDEN